MQRTPEDSFSGFSTINVSFCDEKLTAVCGIGIGDSIRQNTQRTAKRAK
jgi:hypothetical protein